MRSCIEKGPATVKDFYRADELKYHGHGDQRGVARINFFEETKSSSAGGVTSLPNNKCGAQWKYPANCDTTNNTCQYYASWEYLGQKRGKDGVRFTIKTKESKYWTGIGFSKDKKMSQTDAIIGWVDPRSNRPFIMNTWVSGYSAPKLDQNQHITSASGSLIDGYTTLSFVRKRNTGEARDLAFTDEQCLYMMFITQGGGFDAVNKRTSKHLQTPVVSEEKICIRSCGPEPAEDEITTEPPIPGLTAYTMLIRITGLADSFKPPAEGSKEYEELSQQVADSLRREIAGQKGFHKLKLNSFVQNETKAIIAELTLKSIDSNTIEGSSARSLDSTPSPSLDMDKWEKVVKETLAKGRVGNLNVDPEFLVLQPQSLLSSRPNDDPEGNARTFFGLAETKLYVVVGCVAALILVALLQAVCTLYRSRSGQRGKEQLIPNQAWKDYSSANTNYAFEPFENDDKYNSTTSTAPLRDRPPSTPLRPTNPPPPRPGSAGMHHTTQHHPNGNGKMQQNGNKPSKMSQNGNGHHPPHKSPKHNNSAAQYYHETRSLQRPRGQYGYPGRPERATYSLPRGARGEPPPLSNTPQPDFYFMPSQRKYEGEVVRVYVDYRDRDRGMPGWEDKGRGRDELN
ncbi:hypothetical protein O0L34_g1921 [Tuta absoluta]|nr:hypothetical protein O0L34_g1921 [Tuta absoluta]